MKIVITRNEQALKLSLTDVDVEGVFISPGENGVQVLVQLLADTVTIEAEDDADINNIVSNLLREIEDEEED